MELKKAYHSIGEVSELLGIEAHVLRFWETEFSLLRPKKNRAGNRAYRRKDIEVIQKIQFLLYEELYTIEGARNKLKHLKNISLVDYKKTQTLLTDKDFVAELKIILEEMLH